MKLGKALHTALEELRMQMLGTQVLFGFQLQSVFQEGFARIPKAARLVDIVAFGPLVMTLGLLLAPAAQHRLVEKGVATRRMLRTASTFTALALAAYALAIGFDGFAVFDIYAGTAVALIAAGGAVIVAVLLWYVLGFYIRQSRERRKQSMPDREVPPLHEKIDQMLIEARVILPGAQALLGFQFIVTMMPAFASLAGPARLTHFIGLGAVLLAVILLIAPAAIHRVGFGGEDSEQVHDIGTFLVTAALGLLALGVAADVYVALEKAIEDKTVANKIAFAGGAASLLVLAALWFGFPLFIRMRGRA